MSVGAGRFDTGVGTGAGAGARGAVVAGTRVASGAAISVGATANTGGTVVVAGVGTGVSTANEVVVAGGVVVVVGAGVSTSGACGATTVSVSATFETLLAADYFARGKTDAKSIVGMKRIAKRNYLNFKWILIVFFCCIN